MIAGLLTAGEASRSTRHRQWTGKDKDKDQAYKDQDKDKDKTCKDKDKDLNLVLKESLRTRTKINITARMETFWYRLTVVHLPGNDR